MLAERYEDAAAGAERLIASGAVLPQVHWLLGKALQGLGRFDEAEASYGAALDLDAVFTPAHQDLAQLIWMRTEDAAAATARLDKTIASYPNNPNLRVVKAKVLEFAGAPEAGLDALGPLAARTPPIVNVELTASQIALALDAGAGLAHAERALHAAPDDHLVMTTAAEANLAAGRAAAALRLAERVHKEAPHNQHAVALMAAAWRVMDDPRYHALYDYDAFVKVWRLDTPKAWRSLEAWLDDFEAVLTTMHELKAHPIAQSLRGGTQANRSLEHSKHPAVRAFFEAIDGPIRRHIASLGAGDDVLRARSTGDYRLTGSWSVRLRPGGAHVNHIHPAGWLSSACYVALPDAIGAGGKEGWIAFGEPGIPMKPRLLAEHWIKPERGMLVLFPAYMWHGTLPFSGAQPRLTCAFDVVPG
jgi:tetratricopeptide (TPR) repeat protein